MTLTRDISKLLAQYKPLILTVYKRYHYRLPRAQDKEDLLAEINLLFTKLALEYDPKRGVDFPYYIQLMLNRRTQHYVNKQNKNSNREFIGDCMVEVGGFDLEDELQRIDDVLSWDDDFRIGKKQKQLFIDLLRNGKTVKQIAEEEGVNLSTIHTRLHFLIRKLNSQRETQEEAEK